MNDKTQIAVLSIAGSDSGGNAGIQADTRTFHAFGLHACVTFAALTAQNPFEVKSVLVPDTQFIEDQLDAVLGVYDIRALKTGMLATSAVIETIAKKLCAYPDIKKVVDPVMVATSGAKLLADDAVDAVKKQLLPLATLITPNLPEAEVLLDTRIETAADMESAAKQLSDTFGCAALVKGGHKKDAAARDVLFDGSRAYWLSTAVIANPLSTHGTGCSLSAAIAASLAEGRTLLDAVVEGKAYVYESIRTGRIVGGEGVTVLGGPSDFDVAVCTVN